MATDATFDNQLQALATATANFANGKDTAIKNTIITALGGSGGSAKQEGVITIDREDGPNRSDNLYPATDKLIVNYNGDGVLKLVPENAALTLVGNKISSSDLRLEYVGVVCAEATDNFTAAFCEFCFYDID